MTHFRQSRQIAAQLPRRPGPQEYAFVSPQRQIMFSRDFRERRGERRGPREIAAHRLEHRGEQLFVGDVPNLRDLRGSRDHVCDEPTGAIDFSERPHRQRQIRHRGDAYVAAETMNQVAVPLRVENGERLFVIGARLDELADKPVGRAVDAMGDAGLGRMRSPRDIAQECRGELAHGPSSPRRWLPTQRP